MFQTAYMSVILAGPVLLQNNTNGVTTHNNIDSVGDNAVDNKQQQTVTTCMASKEQGAIRSQYCLCYYKVVQYYYK